MSLRTAGGSLDDVALDPALPQLNIENVDIHGYVYEVESGALRRPGERVAAAINTRA